jgi:hypothetical protein
MTAVPNKKDESARYFFCIEYVPTGGEIDQKNWDSLIIETDDPTGSDVFKIHDWGIWCLDDDKRQHWIPWGRIWSINFEENTLLYLPAKKKEREP